MSTRLGGKLVFLVNLEPRTPNTRVKPAWQLAAARDLLDAVDLELKDGAFNVEVPPGDVRVIHCPAN